MLYGIYDKDGKLAFVNEAEDEDDVWTWFLGFPDEGEIEAKKAEGYSIHEVTVEKKHGNDDKPDERLAGATGPVSDRGGIGGPEAVRDNPEDAGQVQRPDLHGVAVPDGEAGQGAAVRVHATGDDAVSDGVACNAEDIRRGRVIAGDMFMHRKRGTSYRILVVKASLQTSQPIAEGTDIIVYMGSDGQIWARPIEEFGDGRFLYDT